MYIRVPGKGRWLILTSHLRGERRQTDTEGGLSTRPTAWMVTAAKRFTQSRVRTHTAASLRI